MKKIFITAVTCLLFSCFNKNSPDIKIEVMEKQNPVDYASDSAIELQTKTFLKTLNSSGGKPMETLTPAEARSVLVAAQGSVNVDLSGIEVSETKIMQDGLEVNLKIVRPANNNYILPAFMFFHGGGWVIGDYATHERFIRDLVVQSGLVAVYVDYSLSPEAIYPTALNQAYAATKWVAENGKQINVDGTRLAVAGNSAGGNIAAAVVLMAKAKSAPAIRFQLLFWPVTNADFETASYNQNATDRFLTKNMMMWFWDNYVPQKAQRQEFYASPLKASEQQLKGLPPALIQTAENDVLRDEGEQYARKLNLAGVPVTLVRYQGLIHDYGLLNPLADIPAVKSALRYAANELAYALK